MQRVLLVAFMAALPALWAEGCDSSGGNVPLDTTDTSVLCDGKQDNPSCYVDATPTDAFMADSSADTNASEDTAPVGDSVSPQEDTSTSCQPQAGMECPGLQNCVLKPRTDGRWDCGNATIQPDFVCQACF